MDDRKRHKGILSSMKTIRMSMLLCFLPVMAIALLILFLFSFQYTDDNVRDNSTEYIMQLINQVNYDIDSYITYMENIASMVSRNNDVLDYLYSNEPKNSEKARMLYKRIQEQFHTVMEARADISNIAVLSNSGRSVINDNNGVLNPYIEITNQSWYQKALKNGRNTTLTSSHVQNLIRDQYSWVVTLCKGLVNPLTDQTAGVFFIDLNYSAIDNLCANISLGKRGYVFILDEEGKMIYHPKQQLIYSGILQEKVSEVLASKSSYFTIDRGEDEKLYTISQSDKTGWTVVGVVYVSELVKNRDKTQVIYGLIASILFLAVIVMVLILSERITRPIKMLKESMKAVEKGHFNPISLTDMPDNEIGSLSRNYNIMTGEIQALMKANVEEQQQKRKSEMRALQSQINPHFLYNTLDSIIWMAEDGKSREVVLMTSALAKMLRRTISNKQEVITIKQELEHVENYLKIQQMRYQDKLAYEIHADKAILNKLIVKLVLQPLVENAIYHGIKYKDGKGLINIRGGLEGDWIIIQISDNGKGMDEETLIHIFEEHKVNYDHNGIGVYNVQKRLQLYYGSEFGVFYESELGEGTTASVIIPSIEERETDE